MRNLFAIAGVILLGISFPAHACVGDTKQAQAKRQKDIYVEYDANHDGKLSYDEYIEMFQDWGTMPAETGYRQFYNNIDKDKSGFLSFDEWAAQHPPEYFATDEDCGK